MAASQNYLTVFCHSCGKKHFCAIPTDDREISFSCKNCGEKVIYSRDTANQHYDQINAKQSSTIHLGLIGKFLLFVLAPLLFTMAAVLYINNDRIRNLETLTIKTNTEIVNNMSEELVFHVVDNVVKQARHYLYTHPNLHKTDFNKDIYFKKTVLQRIGETGATQLYETGNNNGEWVVWASHDYSLVGKNLADLKNRLGDHFPAFWQVMTEMKNEKASKGIYKWPDGQGVFRDRLTVNTAIQGTPFIISASIFLDEISAPLKYLESQTVSIHKQLRNNLFIIQGIGIVVVILTILLFGRSITKRLKRLAHWTDAISLGKFSEESIKDTSKDEIGELTNAIARMRESIRISLDLLKKNK